MTNNFNIEEFTKSYTAKRNNIDNTIPEEYYDNIKNLVNLLQTIRDEWKEAIVITSGYRCDKLNKLVGGVSNSDHRYAAAADIVTKYNNKKENKKLFTLIESLIRLNKISCRQLIDECDYSWIHISVNHSNNSYKDNQILHK